MTIHSSRSRFAARFNSGVRRHHIVHMLRSVAVTALLGHAGLTFRCYAAPVEIPPRLLPDAIPISAKDINTYPAAVDAIIRAGGDVSSAHVRSG